MNQPSPVHRTKNARIKPLTARKKLLRIVLIIASVLLVFSILSVIADVIKNSSYYSQLQNGGSGYEPLDILFAPADYETNIFEDPNYLTMNRDIQYIEGAQSTEISLDEDGSYYGDGLVEDYKDKDALSVGNAKDGMIEDGAILAWIAER